MLSSNDHAQTHRERERAPRPHADPLTLPFPHRRGRSSSRLRPCRSGSCAISRSSTSKKPSPHPTCRCASIASPQRPPRRSSAPRATRLATRRSMAWRTANERAGDSLVRGRVQCMIACAGTMERDTVSYLLHVHHSRNVQVRECETAAPVPARGRTPVRMSRGNVTKRETVRPSGRLSTPDWGESCTFLPK